MKHTITITLAALAAIVLTGCTSTKSTVIEYDAAGNIVKKTETSDSIVKEITESTKGKTVIAWESGWLAYLSASTATTSDPTPTFKMGAGKTDKGIICALPGTEWTGLPEVISATKYALEVSPSGVNNK